MNTACMQPGHVERRHARRVVVRYECEFVAEGAPDTLYGEVVDISVHGVTLRSRQPLRPGTRLRLLVRPSGMVQSLLLHGTVTHRVALDGPGVHRMGVRLHPVD